MLPNGYKKINNAACGVYKGPDGVRSAIIFGGRVAGKGLRHPLIINLDNYASTEGKDIALKQL